MGKAKKAGRGRPPTKKLIQPTILEAGLYPAITRPMSLIGRHINVPGSYWPSQGQNRAELVTLYQCVVTDYTSVHVFPGGKSTPAWRMQEMGVTGTGSLENGPCSGDIFWMPQSDLVPFYWKTYPEEMPLPAGSSTTLNDVGTKQGLPASAYLSAPMSALARTIYLKWLRNAHDVLRGKLPMPLRTSPRKATIANPSKLFRTSCIAAEDADFDEVTDEMARWDSLNSKEIECFRKADGLIDEFALMWAMRLRFPLHFFLFKQTACHLPFEANVERVFSVAGYLSDPCRHAEHLVDMVMAALNRKAYDPSIEAIRAQYYEMFRGIAGAKSVAMDSDSDSSN